MVITQSLTNYYTCLETIFLRISKFFENNLDKDQWHQSLLEKNDWLENIHQPKSFDEMRQHMHDFIS